MTSEWSSNSLILCKLLLFNTGPIRSIGSSCQALAPNNCSSDRGVMVIVVVQILDEADCISHSTNTIGKGMDPIILPPAMGKIAGQTRFVSFGEATSLGEGKL